MTEETEMPNEIYTKMMGNNKLFSSIYPNSYTNTVSYIRRAVSKGEAKEIDDWINHKFRGKTIYEGHPLKLLEKLLEAHK